MASPYRAVQIWVKHFPEYIVYKYRTDLVFGEAVCILIFFHFPGSTPSVVEWFVFFIFDGVTVKTENILFKY